MCSGLDLEPEVRRQPRAHKRVLDAGCGRDLLICHGLWVVVGAARMESAERDICTGDPIGRAEHHRGGEPPLHVHDRAVLPLSPLRIRARDCPLLRRVDHSYDNVRTRLVKG